MPGPVKDESDKGSDKSSRNVSIFNNFVGLLSNNHHIFVVRKSERLASALYVITGFMPSEEPIRTRLRICALEVITHSASPYELQGSGAERFESRCTEIVSILQTAHYSGLISEMNAKLISEEYVSLAAFVRANTARISERGHLIAKSSVMGQNPGSSNVRQRGVGLLKDRAKFNDSSPDGKRTTLDGRKELILKVFDKKESVSIKDVVSFIPGVGEKTIQRDILSLVASGVLTKSGSRRWTTYRKTSVQGQ